MRKVLLVEKDPAIREDVRNVISWEEYGYEVTEAADCHTAMRIMESQPVELVILELGQSKTEGFTLIREAREQIDRNIYFSILTRYESFSAAQEALKLKVLEYFIKPVKKEELERLLQHVEQERKKDKNHEECRQAYERIRYNRGIIHVLLGKYTEEELALAEKMLYSDPGHSWRFVSFELEQEEKELTQSQINEKVAVQNECMGYLKRLLKQCASHVVPLISAGKSLFGVGIIMNTTLLKRMNMKEMEFICYLGRKIERQFGCEFKTYMGAQVSSLAKISESFRSLNIVRSFYGIAKGNRKLVCFDEFTKESSTFLKPSNVAGTIVQEIGTAVQQEDTEKIVSTVDTLCRQMSGENLTIGKVTELIFGVLYGLKEMISGLDSESSQSAVLQSLGTCLVNQFVSYGNLQGLDECLLEYTRHLHELKQKEQKSILECVEEYINDNYASNLTLKSLGEQFYINSVYLGQLFKRKYGMSFKSYLTQLRISKSVQLLKETALRIYVIAEKVGFQSADYFINKFVQEMGRTPQQFRMEYQMEYKKL